MLFFGSPCVALRALAIRKDHCKAYTQHTFTKFNGAGAGKAVSSARYPRTIYMHELAPRDSATASLDHLTPSSARVLHEAKRAGAHFVSVSNSEVATWPDMTGPESLERFQGALTELLYAVGSVVRKEHESALGRLRCAAAALQLRPDCFTLPIEPLAVRIRCYGGLAPWQVRRVTNHIECHLDTAIRSKDLAAMVRLSSSYFSRAFRGSFGQSTGHYVHHRRMERAQGLMLTTDESLGRIALECGMSDQAHFNKLFHRIVGETPGAWRRARKEHVSTSRARPGALKSPRPRNDRDQ